MSESAARLNVASLWDGTPADPSEMIWLEVRWDERGVRIAIDAPFWDDPQPADPPGSTDGLWDFEVVELFVASAADPTQYTEIEIGPFGHYLVLLFSGVRQRLAEGIPIDISVARSDERWTANAALDRDHLPPEPWLANAYAIHGTAGARRYLAWHALPGPRADFHQPERFVPLI